MSASQKGAFASRNADAARQPGLLGAARTSVCAKRGTMKLRIQAPPSAEIGKRAGAELARAVTAGVAAATEGLKLQLRQQVGQAGLGERLGRAIGSALYPRAGRASLRAAGLVFPRGAGAEKIFRAFNEGSVIRASGAGWLAIPTENVPPLGRSAKVSPRAVEAFFGRPLRYVPPLAAGGRAALLVMDGVVRSRRGRSSRRATPGRVRQGRTVQPLVMFILVPEARMGKRLDFEALAGLWADRIPSLIERALPSS